MSYHDCVGCLARQDRITELEENIRTQSDIMTKWGMEGSDRARYLKALEEMVGRFSEGIVICKEESSQLVPLEAVEIVVEWVLNKATTAINGGE